MNVLVTGATGAVGPRVVALLLERGFHTRAFARRPGGIPESVDLRIGDINDRSAVRDACESIDVVLHLAALLHVVNPSRNLQSEYQRVNVEGTASVLREAVAAGVKRVVLFSTIAVYGPTHGLEVDERSDIFPDTDYAKTKAEAEALVLSARRADGEPVGTVLRLGAVYGARVKGNYDRLIRAMARGRFIPIGSGLNRRTLIYEGDVAEAALLAAVHPAAEGEIFNVTDGTTHTVNEILLSISEALAGRPPRFALPIAPIRAGLCMADLISKWTGVRTAVGRATLDKYLEDVAVSGDKAQRVLGFKAATPLDEGWKKTIFDMQISGR